MRSPRLRFSSVAPTQSPSISSSDLHACARSSWLSEINARAGVRVFPSISTRARAPDLQSTPSAFEKLSHGTPTFHVEKYKNVFTMFADNHHQDGHLAVWLPAPPGLQAALLDEAPKTYFKPPYVGSSGWIGINLDQIGDEALEIHVRKAWELSAPEKKRTRIERAGGLLKPRD